MTSRERNLHRSRKHLRETDPPGCMRGAMLDSYDSSRLCLGIARAVGPGASRLGRACPTPQRCSCVGISLQASIVLAAARFSWLLRAAVLHIDSVDGSMLRESRGGVTGCTTRPSPTQSASLVLLGQDRPIGVRTSSSRHLQLRGFPEAQVGTLIAHGARWGTFPGGGWT